MARPPIRRRAICAVAAAFLVACAARAVDDSPRRFAIPAGDAAEALREFVRQSGGEIMFLSGSLQGLATAAVNGEFTPPEAIRRLIAGDALAVRRDPRTGAFAITRVEADRIVRLPPYLVEGNRDTRRWKYAAIPGFEALSCCSTKDTEDVMGEVHREQAWFDQIVPPGLQGMGSVPTRLILFSDDAKKTISENVSSLAGEYDSRLRLKLAEAGLQIPHVTKGLIPQVKLWDEDSTAVDMVLRYLGADSRRNLSFQLDYVLFLLARRAPPLPSWYIEGVLRLYQSRGAGPRAGPSGTVVPVMVGLRGGMSVEFGPGAGSLSPQRQVFLPVTWVAPGVTDLIREDPSLAGRVAPLRDLLAGPPPAARAPGTPGEVRAEEPSPDQARGILAQGAGKDSPWRRDLWASEALLFVRWALDDPSFERRHALWKLVARAGSGPVDEAMFRDCFGMGFDEADAQLAGYLGDAVARRFVLIPESPVDYPFIDVEGATEAQSSRVLGDWERMEYEFVRESHPEFAAAYARQAARTFQDAYDDGVRDPEFLAAFGIYECTVGDDARAAGYLEAAVHAGAARPRAFVELARIRYGEAIANPTGPGRWLGAAQVASVLGLIRAAGTLEPRQLAGYAAAADVLAHAAAPSAGDLGILDEGVRCFPYDSRLALERDRLRARLGARGPEK